MAETKRDACENCSYETELRKVVTQSPTRPAMEVDEWWFCEICSTTLLSRATSSPYRDQDVRLHRSLGWIANMLRDEIRSINADRRG